LAPRLRSIFVLGSPSVVSVGNAPFSYRRFILKARFRPPEGFFLCRSPCETDICCVPLLWFDLDVWFMNMVWWFIKLFFDV
jgi:hypothetical protein